MAQVNALDPRFRRGVLALGVLLTLLGAAGTLALSAVLFFLFQAIVEGGQGFWSSLALFHLLWLVFTLSLFASGVTLIAAAVQGRRRDLVSGPWLYLLGASLAVIGLYLLLYQPAWYAWLALVLGLVVIWAEWALEIT